jgi:hypothetical protein
LEKKARGTSARRLLPTRYRGLKLGRVAVSFVKRERSPAAPPLPPRNGYGSPVTSDHDPAGYDAIALADEIRELSASCEQHVRDAVGLELDGTIETLPILDHYVRLSRPAVKERPELLPLLARTVGAYFGQVVADHFGGFWSLTGPDASNWHVCLRSVYLAFNPIGMAHAALTWSLEEELAPGPPAELRLSREDRAWVEQRLEALPPVREGDFFSLSTRVEGIEIAVHALGEHMAQAGTADVVFDDDDYAEDLAILTPAHTLN